MKYMKECKDYYDKHWEGENIAPIGCTEEEVRALEARMGFRLPEAQREFLLWMGNDHQGILRDGYWYLKDLESNTEWLWDVLEPNGVPRPEGKYVSCYNYQGYAAGWYMMPAESEDPPMYFFIMKDPGHPEPYIFGTFSQWVLWCVQCNRLDVDDQLEARKKYNAEQAALKSAGTKAEESNAAETPPGVAEPQ